jgi:TolA-binding protein
MQKRFFLLILILTGYASQGQLSKLHLSPENEYIEAVELYNEKQYKASEYLLNQIKPQINDRSILGDIYFYLASIAVRTNETDAEELLNYFTDHFPNHPKRNAVFFEAADYYFTHNNLNKARELIKQVDPSALDKNDYEKYNFYRAYTYLKEKKYKNASRLFDKLLNSKNYGQQAKYYTGYIAYQQNDFAKAQKYFNQITEDPNFNKKLPYYRADMYFKLGKFKQAIDEASKIYKKSRGKEHSELAKIIGESYFNLKEYEKAIPYLLAYKGKGRGRWSNTDYYQLGYAYYKQGDYKQAINNFNKIIEGNDAIAQNAYYHLADSYLKTGQKLKALNAFKKVSEMPFDPKMQEDAYYNYAKLGYEIGNPFENPAKVIQNYLKKYPNSLYKEEMEDLLVNSYLTSKNFEEAIKILEKNKETLSKTYQKATYYRGLELMNEGNYTEAQEMFNKLLQNGFDPKLRQMAKFWNAEANYRLHRYNEAKIGFEDFVAGNDYGYSKESKLAHYNLGYTYFKLKDYPHAAIQFKKFIETRPDRKLLKDAYLRMGDSYFAQKKYWPAMEAYNKAIQIGGSDTDYAAYQKAISYGFVGKNNRKINDLKTFIQNFPHSKYMPDALYQLGSTYANKGNKKEAIKNFEKLLREYPHSKYVPIVLLKEGSIYYNDNNNGKALEKFKLIIEKYPNTPIAYQAVENIKNIYVEQGKAEEYAQWANKYPWINVSNTELDQAVFETAQEKYINKNPEAINELEKYLQQFPYGINSLKAHYYLANLYKKKGKKGKEALHYTAIVELPQNQYTAEALRNLAFMRLERKEWEKAIPYLERLENISDSPEDKVFAQSNLMKAYYQTQDFEEATNYAEKVIANPKSSSRMKNDAQLIIARSSLKTGDEDKAKKYYKKLAGTSNGQLAAESLYYIAYFQNKDNQYDASNKTIAKLTKNYANQKYWAAKSLVLMARNTYAKGDTFNATYILESVIKNFKQYPDVVKEAQELLMEIKKKEKNTPTKN